MLDGKASSASGIVASGNTLTIRFVRPVADFVESGAAELCVLPAGLPIQAGGVTAPVPTPAPYFISEYVPGQRIVLERNPYYGGGRPHHLDSFVFDLTVDTDQAVQNVIDGRADYAFVPPSAFPAEVGSRFGVNRTRFFVEPTSFLRLFVLNTSRPLLANNAPLRQAINYAIDRPALLRQFGPLAGTPVDHYLPPGVPGYRNEHVFPVGEPDVQKARALARGHRRSGTLVLYVNDRPGVPEQAPSVAYGVDNALTLVSARTGCVIVNPFLDLAAVCVK